MSKAVQLYASAVRKTKRKPKRKPNARTRQRMYQVMQLMGTFVPHATMVKKLMGDWNVTQSTVERIITLVHEEWAETSSKPDFVDKRRDQLRQGWQVLYMKACASGDLKTAAVCLRELGTLDGCYMPTKVEAQGTFTGIGLGLGTLGYNSPDAVRDRIDELQGRLSELGPMGLAEFAKAQAQLQAANVIDVEAEEE